MEIPTHNSVLSVMDQAWMSDKQYISLACFHCEGECEEAPWILWGWDIAVLLAAAFAGHQATLC